MLDINFIRRNPKLVEEKAKQKGFSVDIQQLLKIDNTRREVIEEVDKLHTRRKKLAVKRDKKGGIRLKQQLKKRETELEELNEKFYKLARQIPNLPKDDVPPGNNESENQTVREVAKRSKFSFEVKNHLELAMAMDLVDLERASKISGTRFAFLKNELVILEFALIKFAIDFLTEEGFIALIPPVIVNRNIIEGLGYPEYLTGEGYKLDDQYLVGTAEHSIVAMHTEETFDENDLPRRYVGFSTCFRREAGTYGRDTRGIFRVHQFDKVEMVSFVKQKDDDREHEYLLSLQEKLFQSLDIPYRVVEMCTADLGFPTARKFDLEVWIPSQGKYREVTSCSSTTDFQARRLNIKYKEDNNKIYAHILNGTAFAIGRTLIAILENYQKEDGSVEIPKILQKYTQFAKIPSSKI